MELSKISLEVAKVDRDSRQNTFMNKPQVDDLVNATQMALFEKQVEFKSNLEGRMSELQH